MKKKTKNFTSENVYSVCKWQFIDFMIMFCFVVTAYESNEMSFGRNVTVQQGRCEQYWFSGWRWVCQTNYIHKSVKFPHFIRNNCIFLSLYLDRYIRVSTGPGQHFVFAIIPTPDVPKNSVGFSLVQRKWASISVNQDIDVKVYRFNPASKTEFLDTVTLEVDFLSKKT